MALNLVVGEINRVSPKYIVPTFNTCIKEKNSKCLHFNIETWFLNSTIAKMRPSISF